MVPETELGLPESLVTSWQPDRMQGDRLLSRFAQLPEAAQWPQLLEIVARVAGREAIAPWQYPLVASLAVGGTAENAESGAAAILCAVESVHLVDDLLDEEPDGLHHRVGIGSAANLALALQAAGHRLLAEAPGSDADKLWLQVRLADIALSTAHGQSIDDLGVKDEIDYWRVARLKNTPIFGGGLAMGAVLGGGGLEAARVLEGIGGLFGLVIQVSDDLADALRSPASPDWRRPRNNLALLFALSSDHPEREAFAEHAANPSDLARLSIAQSILVRSGAISYCAYCLVALGRQIKRSLGASEIRDPGPLLRLLGEYVLPLQRLLVAVGAESLERDLLD